MTFLFLFYGICFWVAETLAQSSIINDIPLVFCDGDYLPSNCGLPDVNLSRLTSVEDFDRCGPAVMSKLARNFFWGRAGKGLTYRQNLESFKRVAIIPTMMQDVSSSSLVTTLLGQTVEIPIGFAPVALKVLAHPVGDVGAARVASRAGTVLILSSMSTFPLEVIAEEARIVHRDKRPVLWMQLYFFKNKNEMLQLVKRAEDSGYSALVVNVDFPLSAKNSCDGRAVLRTLNFKFPNLLSDTNITSRIDSSATFKNLRWLKTQTRLPIVAKGVITVEDGIRAVRAGASAILVSNHGGRQLDGVPASFKVLSDISEAVKSFRPSVEVYLDGGIRNGYDVYKAIAKGAKAVFIGRPAAWGLAIGGENGVEKVLSILRTEFNETMLLAGATNPDEISSESVKDLWPIVSIPFP